MSRLLVEYPPQKLYALVGSCYDRQAPREGRLACPGWVFPTTTKTGRWGLGRLKALLDLLSVPVVAAVAVWILFDRKLQVVVSVAHGYFFLAAAAACGVMGKPFVLIVHDDWVAMQKGGVFFGAPVLKWVHRWAVRRAATVYAIGPFMQEYLKQTCGVEAELQPPASEPPQEFREAAVPEINATAPCLVYAGLLSAPDSLEILIRALRGNFLMARGIIDWRLEVYSNVGRELFRKLCPGSEDPRIRLCGWVSQDRIRQVLAQADILFLPSSFLPSQQMLVRTLLPTKTADYLASGKPILVLAPPYSSLYRYAVAHQFAEVVGTFSAEDAAEGIRNLLNSRHRREALYRKSRELFRSHHDMRLQRGRFHERLRHLTQNRRILYFQYTNPAGYPPIEHSSRILADAGWRVLFLGTGAFGGADALRLPHHERIEVKRMPFQPAGWRQKLHYMRFALWVLWWTWRWRPGWVYASDTLSAPVALLLGYLSGVRILYHEHDSPPPRNPMASLLLWTRCCLARRAELCVLPNERRAERFLAETGRASRKGSLPTVVWNCPTRDEVAPRREAHHGDRLRIRYHGSIVPEQLSEEVLKAIALLPESATLDVIGYETVGHVGYAQQLQRLAGELGIQGRVEFLGAVPRSQLIRLSRDYDVGLALIPMRSGDVNFQRMVGASNKPFDYLTCGLALLVSDLPDWRRAFVEPGYGLACDPEDPKSIAQALRWFLEHPDQTREMGERGRQRILSEWNYETQFKPVLERLREP